jgi:cytochrome c551/c552
MAVAGKTACILACATLLGAAFSQSREIQLPAETTALRASTLPGYRIATQKCGICHSADYITLQPPAMSLKQWTAEMVKMQHAYGAPLDDEDIKPLAVYLAVTYGDAGTVPEADRLLPGPPPAVAAGAALDVQTLLAKNACLGCHALNAKLIGPSYHDVAAKYRNAPEAAISVAASIRDGSSNKWGAVPMPAFPNLAAQELQVLAAFVLGQP